MFSNILILIMIYNYGCDWPLRYIITRRHEYVYTISTHTIMVDKIHSNGRWRNIYLCIFYFQYRGHWWPGKTRSQGISDHDTDLFIPDSLWMLGVNVCNYDYWKHTHAHMTVQNHWSHWGPSITSQIIYQGFMSPQYNFNRERWLWPSKSKSKVYAMCKSMTWYHCFCRSFYSP